MTPTRRRFLGAVTASTAFGVAGCLGDGEGDTPTETETQVEATETEMETEADEETPGSGGESEATLQVSSHAEHGDVLVGPEGMTLYNFDADTQGAGESACPGIEGCDEAWPPLAVESADDVSAGTDVEADLSTFEREDGTIQVTANGWPLYYFAQDGEPGDVEGHGANDVWWVMNPSGEPQRPEGAAVAVSSHDEHGDVLVDGEGMTLYMFDSDEQGAAASTCTGGCLDAWPPLTSEGEPSADDGVTAELTTFERDDGSTQVAANGWPLYYFAQDEEPGDVEGQGANDVWWVLDPAGGPVRPEEMGGSEADGGNESGDDGSDGDGDDDGVDVDPGGGGGGY